MGSATSAKNDILQGWKDIAAYVSRDVRTVRRWEKQRGLPVRRMPGDGRANVYALVTELDVWLLTGVGLRPESPDESEAEALNDAFDPAEESELGIQPFAAPATATAPAPDIFVEVPRARRQEMVRMPAARRPWVLGSAAIVCLSACAALALGLRASWLDRGKDAAAPASVPHAIPSHISPVKGVEDLYLRGIYFYEQRTPETLELALKCFHDAIALDASYAPAYAGLAQTYNVVRQYSMMPDAEAYAQAQTAAERAITLDPRLPEAHASLGFVKFFWDWDAAAAENEFHTALALDPRSSLAHHWYGSMLTHQGRFTESLAELELAQRLEPASTSILGDKAFALALSGRPVEARSLLQQVLNQDQKSPAPHYIMAVICLLQPQDVRRHLDELRRFATLRHDAHLLSSIDVMDAAFKAGGTDAMWRAVLAEETGRQADPAKPTYRKVKAECFLGVRDACLHDLDQLVTARDHAIIGLKSEPAFASIQSDPRFLDMIARLGIDR